MNALAPPTNPGTDARWQELLRRELVSAIRPVLAELHQLRAETRDRRLRQLSRADRDRLETFLHTVFAARNGCPFLAAEVSGVIPAFQSNRALGKFLSRVEGTPLGGLMIERAGREDNRELWRVVLGVP